MELVIDGETVELVPNGENDLYEKYKEPQEFTVLGPGKAPLIVTVYRKPGWKPSDGVK